MAADASTQRPIVVVVGASGALGQAICDRVAAEGTDLLVTYWSNRDAVQTLADRLSERVEVSIARVDLTDAPSIEVVAAQVEASGQHLQSVVFAPGVAIEQPRVLDVLAGAWQLVVETELFGFAAVARAFIPIFRSQQAGTFVCVTTFANFRFQVGDALSSVPKAAIESMVRSIALEEGRHGVRANCVAPGVINAGLGAAFQQSLYSPDTWDRARKHVPMRRFGEADEIAEAVWFLASERSSYITGTTLVVDGGSHL